MNCFGGCNSWIIILILICLFCDNGVGFGNNGCGNNCGCATPFGGRGCGCGFNPRAGKIPPVHKRATAVFLRRPWLLRSAKRTRLRNNRWRIAK